MKSARSEVVCRKITAAVAAGEDEEEEDGEEEEDDVGSEGVPDGCG